MKFVVAEKDKLFFVGEVVRHESRNLDGKLVTFERVALRGEGDWLKGAVEQKVLELNKEAA